MAVSKRTWRHKGETKTAWVVRYADAAGKWRLKTFTLKRAAEAYDTKVKGELQRGVHTPDSVSITVAEAGKLWLQTGENDRLERTSLDRNRMHLDLHIAPVLGGKRLSELTIAMIRDLEDALHQKGLSASSVRGIIVSLGSILSDAQERGLVAQNVVRSRRRRRSRAETRRKLEVGVDIPAPDEIKALIPHLPDRYKPVIMTAIFTGLRASELRGLRWSDVDLKRGEIHVRQRADRFNAIGAPKSKAGTRTVPLPPNLVAILREWKLACPNGPHGLAFPNGNGNIDKRRQIVNAGLKPAWIKAGIVTADGTAKYPGLHALRHFYASWCLNRRASGGLELPIKDVQARLGHANIMETADTYGHLFPSADDGTELAAAEQMLLGA